MDSPSSPATESEPAQRWRDLVAQIKAGETPLGERLYLLAAGPVPVEGAAGGGIALDRDGGVVVAVAVETASASVGSQIARQVEGLSRLPGEKLREAGVDPGSGGGLVRRHAAYFDLGDSPAELNSSQRAAVILAVEPPAEALEDLIRAFGDIPASVFVASDSDMSVLGATEPVEEIVLEPDVEAEPEAEAEPEPEPEVEVEDDVALVEAEEMAAVPGLEEEEEEAPAEPDLVGSYLEEEATTVLAEESDVVEKTGLRAWPIGNWIGLAMVLLGIVILAVAIPMAFDGEETGTDTGASGQANPEIRTVVTGVVPDATHGRWIGQQRVVTLSDGSLVFVYASEGSLELVTDDASAGETWSEPFTLEEFAPVSLSVDVDSKDRIHVAYSDGAAINYVRLKNKPAGWKPSRLKVLDEDTTSLNVDVAWDEQNQTAHVVWVQQSDEGEAPAWAALTNEGGIHLTEGGLLASAGTEVPVLASVAVDGRSSLLVSYRAGDQAEGWFSRYSPGRSTDGTWLFNEADAVPVAAFVGAADVVYDQRKTAHLVLRDSTNYALTYYSKKKGEEWSQGEVALEGESVDALDFPTLSYATTDKYLYLFFQTTEFDPAGEVAYLVRDDTNGWQGPYDIVSPADAPEGALYPSAPDRVEQQAIVMWTKTAETYEVNSAPVRAP